MSWIYILERVESRETSQEATVEVQARDVGNLH